MSCLFCGYWVYYLSPSIRFCFFCVFPFLDVHKEGILGFLDDFKRLEVEGLLTQEWSSVHASKRSRDLPV